MFVSLSSYSVRVAVWLFLLIIFCLVDMYYFILIDEIIGTLRSGVRSEDIGRYAALWGSVELKTMMIGVETVFIFILSCIFFCLWGYRVAVNAVSMARHPLELHPGCFIGSFFVPFINFWRPYMGMKRIYNVSHSRETLGYKRFSLLVAFWWASFLMTGLIGRGSFYLFRHAGDAADVLNNGTGELSEFFSLYHQTCCFSLVSDSITIIGALFSIFLVRSITRAQMDMKKRGLSEASRAVLD